MSILVYPDDRLRESSIPVESPRNSFSYNDVVGEMIVTMRKHPMSVGLSAVQIGVPLRIFLMIQDPHARVPTVVINPILVDGLGDKVEITEGCLSFPGIFEEVSRFPKVKIIYETVDYPSREVRVVDTTLEAMPAQIFQHELEHLNGELMVDHLDERSQKRIRNKLNKWKEKGYVY